MPYKKRKVGGYPTKRGVSSAQRRALTKARKTRKDNRLARQRQARRTPSSPSPPQQCPPRSPSPPSGQSSPQQSPPRSMSPPSGQSPPPSGQSPPQSPPSGVRGQSPPPSGQSPRLFCGNNSNFSGLTNGTHVVGTRKKCLRRGRKIGYAMPADPDYAGAYQPITARQLHCEDTNVVPPNHTLGTLHWCLSKGIGFGKAKKARDTFGP